MTSKDNQIRDKVIKGLALVHKRLIQLKKERNLDLVISENGKVVRLRAKDLK